MEIKCQHCGSAYDIPDERLQKFGDHVTLPCPKCKEKIEITLRTDKEEQPEKPSEPAASSTGLTGEELKKKILSNVKDLPPMPQVAQKAREVIADKQSSFMDLAKVIETDQAIATRVLKIANSPYYGSSGKVTSIQQASVILGMKTLNELLTMACASSVLGSDLKGYRQEAGDFWQHSLAVAMGAKSLAEKKHPGLANDAFSAGLLHDCGKIILEPYIFDRTDEFQGFMGQGEKSFLEAEKHILGFDHAEIAAEVCEKWNISEKLATAIRYHHSPSTLEMDALACIIHAADAISMMSGVGAGIDGMMYQLDDQAMKFLGLDDEAVTELMVEIIENVEKTVSGV